MFNEAFSGPREDQYGYPGINYPTADPRDLLIIEDYQARSDVYHALGYGTPHDKDSSCVLCWQAPTKGDGVEKNVRRYYANLRLAQETYNLQKGDSEADDQNYPVFVRSYLLPRGYTKGVMGTALGALIGLTLNGGGAGYGNNGQLALAFSGGSGTGAAGFAEVVGGVIVAVFLTRSGTGYVSAPTVTAAGGTGLSVTALLQPTYALLTNETEGPAEEPYAGYFVRVIRTWESLNGPELIKLGYEPETGARMRTVRQPVLPNAVPIDLATARSFGPLSTYCVDSYVERDSVNKATLVSVWMEIPATFTQKSSEKSVCPAIFTFITGWVISGDGFSNHGPFAGVNFTLTAKRTAVAVEEEVSYTVGASGVDLPTLWNVVSPGAASRFFPLSGDTIHNAIFITESGGSGTQTEEDLPASTPTSYTPGQDMVIHASEKAWKYSVFNEKRIATATEPT